MSTTKIFTGTTKIFVGFTTRAVPESFIADAIPEFEGNKGTNDPEKIQAQIADKRARWLAEAKNVPYTGTFDQVSIAIQSPGMKSSAKEFSSEGRYPFGDKSSVSAQVGLYLKKMLPNAWGNDILSRNERDVVFIGFNMRLFLKMLGLECASSAIGVHLPIELWYGNSDHRGIEEALLPFPTMAWKTALAYYRIGLEGENLEKYDAMIAGWNGPGVSAEKDKLIAAHFAAQLGFMTIPSEAKV